VGVGGQRRRVLSRLGFVGYHGGGDDDLLQGIEDVRWAAAVVLTMGGDAAGWRGRHLDREWMTSGEQG
jgi:hypothetical protein